MENSMRKEQFRFGMSTVGADLTETHFEEYARAGVRELELSFGHGKHDAIDWQEIRRWAEIYGICLWSFHLPFAEPIDISRTDRSQREYAVAYLCEMTRKAADIGIERMVIHPSREPNEERERQERIRYAQNSLAQISQVAGEYGATIAIENLPRTCLGRNSDEINQLLTADDRLRVCFDTNHLLIQPIKEFVLSVGNKIITTHFSDFDFINERHWLPGEGEIDWKELIEALETVGYEGPILYEVSFKAPATIDRRMLTTDDFRENHYLVKNKLPIQPIGKKR